MLQSLSWLAIEVPFLLPAVSVDSQTVHSCAQHQKSKGPCFVAIVSGSKLDLSNLHKVTYESIFNAESLNGSIALNLTMKEVTISLDSVIIELRIDSTLEPSVVACTAFAFTSTSLQKPSCAGNPMHWPTPKAFLCNKKFTDQMECSCSVLEPDSSGIRDAYCFQVHARATSEDY